MGKLGDLWVRLGLKSDDYKKGMKEAKKETSNFSKGLQNMKAGALAVWAAIGAAVMQFTKDFINATNKVGDAWNNTMEGVKAAYQNTLAQIAQDGNWKTLLKNTSVFSALFNIKESASLFKKLFGNAKEAGQAAAEMSKAFDAEFELVNSVKLQKAMMQEELNDLYIKMRDTTLSAVDRQAAAEKYKSLLQPLADAEVRVYSNMLAEASKAWQSGVGLSRQYSTAEMRDFFAQYGIDPTGAAAKYGELASVYENMKGDEQNQVIFDILSKLENAKSQMSDIDKTLSRTTLAISKELAALGAAFNEELAADLEAGLEEVNDAVDELEDVDVVFPEMDLSALDRATEQVKQFVEDWEREQEEIARLNGMLEDSIVSSLTGGMEAFTDMLFGLEGADAKNILAALISPFADTATQLGGMLIAQGLGIEAFKESLKSLQGTAAIAAGTALLAVGAAMRSGIRALAGGGAGSGTSYGGGSYGSTGDVMNYDSTLTIYVEGKISGSDILISGKKTQNKWDR